MFDQVSHRGSFNIIVVTFFSSKCSTLAFKVREKWETHIFKAQLNKLYCEKSAYSPHIYLKLSIIFTYIITELLRLNFSVAKQLLYLP